MNWKIVRKTVKVTKINQMIWEKLTKMLQRLSITKTKK